MKKLFVILLLVGIFTLTACNGSEKDPDDYSGVYKSDDSSEVVINKENDAYKVNISIYRLAAFYDCFVDNVKNNVLNIRSRDPNGNTIKFTFDYKTKVLTVTETTWDLLKVGDSFIFDK